MVVSADAARRRQTAARAPKQEAHVLALARHPLENFFSPRTVAVVGASDAAGSVGRTILWNLTANPFGGTVFPVNPNRSTVLGIKAYPSLMDVPEQIDLVVVVTPAPTVPSIIADAVTAGITSAIVISAGFKEAGPGGAELERRILDEGKRGGMRIIGPNCLGVMVPDTGLNASFAGSMARPGTVGFISQSGALCTAVLDWSHKMAVGFSAFVSVGSMVDVDWGDLVGYLGSDARTRSILIYMESIGNARSFLSAAREVAFSKPIIVIKAGRTQAAARAAASHTGALTGSDDVLEAAFRRCGVLRVGSIAELFYMAEVLGKQPRPRGPRLTIVTNAGGPGVLACDALIGHGGELTPLSEVTMRALDALLPAHWSRNNPVDILGDAGPDRYESAVGIAAKDPRADGLLVVLAPQAMTDPTRTAEVLAQHATGHGKPVLASWMGGADVAAGEEILNRAGIPTFPYPDTAAKTFAYMWRFSDNLRGLYETPVLPDDAAGIPNRAVAAAIIGQAHAEDRTVLTEHESTALVAAYGIPAGLARPGEEHAAGAAAPPMTLFDGCELAIGCRLDAQFGPVLSFGAGGRLVDVLADRTMALPPLTTTLARRMMERTRIFAALKAAGGCRPADLAALEQLLVRFSQLVAEQPCIKEIEINPLSVSAGQLEALHARVVLHDAALAPEALPRLAIRPYPRRYVREATLKDGETMTIRPIRAEDEPLMVSFHEGLSDRSVYLRYFHMMKLGQRVAHERLTRICFIDYDREIALVAERRGPENGGREIVGVARLQKNLRTNVGEFSVVVTDRYQGRGLGSELMRRLIEVARVEGLSGIEADVLADNIDMQRMCLRLGLSMRPAGDAQLVKAELTL